MSNSPFARICLPGRRLLASAVSLLLFTLVFTGAAAAKTSFSARLTKTSFSSAQAASVKLSCKFAQPTKSLTYKISLQGAKKWSTVKAATLHRSFKGSYSISIKTLFAGKAIKLGTYRLALSAAGSSKTLSFKVVKAAPVSTASAPRNTSLPTITGTTREGQTLQGTAGSWSGSPAPSLDYQWQRCDSSGSTCAAVSGATGLNYLLGTADVGSTIKLSVSARNSAGSVSSSSTASSVVLPLPPSSTVLPAISGSARDGRTLSAYPGTWTGSPTSFGYQWLRCDAGGANCSGVAGATSSSYVLAAADDNSTLRFQVTAANAGGSTSATSNATVAVVPVAKQVSESLDSGCAVMTDGSVRCWGLNYYGELGDGGHNDSATPVQVSGIANAVQVSAAGSTASYASHACALLASGTVWCWGANSNGALGDNSRTDSPAPVQVHGVGNVGYLSNITQISSNGGGTCALDGAGSVYCWGSGGSGQLGNGTIPSWSTVPVQVLSAAATPLTGVAQISAGGLHVCALLQSEALYCWGYNYYGQLGNGASGSSANSSYPVQVQNVGGGGQLTGVTRVSSGAFDTCAIASGSLYCWGQNGSGQLGNGQTTNSSVPVNVYVSGTTGPTLAGVIGVSPAEYTTCALLSGGLVDCWGSNYAGQLGNGTTSGSYNPVQVYSAGATPLTDVTQISAGNESVCALLPAGAVSCWGDNGFNQLGAGLISSSDSPLSVAGISGALDVAAGVDQSCAVVEGATSSDNTVWCWGHNLYGQLGNGTTTDSASPVEVLTGPGTPLTNVKQVVAGLAFACAALNNGSVWCWGRNDYAQLGQGAGLPVNSSTHAADAVQVVGLGGVGLLGSVSKISAGNFHVCVLRTTPDVLCWGRDSYGQLGNGTTGSYSNVPVTAAGMGNAIEIAAGEDVSCGVLSAPTAGSVYCWGHNNAGQLGNNNSGVNSSTPVQVVSTTGSGTLSGATAVSAGGMHVCAIVALGGVDCWGYGFAGDLGNGSGSSNSSYPVNVFLTNNSGPVLDGALLLALGYQHSCAARASDIQCWGWNTNGQLGDGSRNSNDNPGAVISLTSVSKLSAGGDNPHAHTCAALADKTVSCWGSNIYGELGTTGLGWSVYPLAVVLP